MDDCEHCVDLVLRVSALEKIIADLTGSRFPDPSAQAAWQTVRSAKGKWSSSRLPMPKPIALSNRYDVLSVEEFPLPQTKSLPASSALSAPAPTACPTAARPVVVVGGVGGPLQGPPINHSITTLVVGSSLVRGVSLPSVPNSQTLCFPGAKVRTMSRMFPAILDRHLGLQRIIIHVGTNDIMARTNVTLFRDYTAMINDVRARKVKITVSGPLPTHGRGDERWSRLYGFHCRLKQFCLDRGLDYADNFDLFNANRNWFKRDGLHLTPAGTRQLSLNMAQTAILIQPSSLRVSLSPRTPDTVTVRMPGSPIGSSPSSPAAGSVPTPA